MSFNFDTSAMFEAAESLQGPLGKKSFGPDERFWKLSRDKSDNGAAQIRLMPNVVEKDGETKLVPYVRVYEHTIKIKDEINDKFKYFIEESPTSLQGGKCAATDLFIEVGKIDNELAKELKGKITRKVKMITNITIVNEPLSPENNGKIMLWSYGTKLDEKFKNLMSPSKQDIDMGAVPVPLYDLVNGANFNLKIKRAGDFLNYDNSEKGPSGALKQWASSDEVEEYIKSGHSIQEWYEPSHYIDYEAAKARLRKTFEGTKYEQFLKSINSFIYETETFENDHSLDQTPVEQTPVEQAQVETPVVQQEPVQTTPEVSAPSMDTDLDFLAEM